MSVAWCANTRPLIDHHIQHKEHVMTTGYLTPDQWALIVVGAVLALFAFAAAVGAVTRRGGR